MDTILLNSKSNEECDPHTLLINLTDKINLKRVDKYVALSNLSVYNKWRNIKKLYKKNEFKI